MSRIFILVISSLLISMAPIDLQGIYGRDDRQDMYQVVDPAIKRIAESTMGIFADDWLTPNGNYYKVTSKPLGEYFNLCPKEKFWNQPVSPDCSAALIGPDLALTAGHCISTFDCPTKLFAFGYQYKRPNQSLAMLPASDVYRCNRILAWQNDGTIDFAIVELDREVKNRTPLKLAKKNAAVGSSVFMLGHPSGLPLKYSGRASVKEQYTEYFLTDLDTFTGNSGSAVFSSATKEIVGVLVRGHEDFIGEDKTTCSKINYCTDCPGEDVTNIEVINEHIFESKKFN